jgi:hypothetical protein
VRLVYCLGYGEPEVLTGTPKPAGETWQYWDLFGDCVGHGKQPRKGNSTWQERIRWKVETLERLRDRGIWLLDASVHGIYAPSDSRRPSDSDGPSAALRKRVPSNVVAMLHRDWWRNYGRERLAESPSAPVWAIGGPVRDALQRAGHPANGWVYQPNAQVSNEARGSRMRELLTAISSLS